MAHQGPVEVQVDHREPVRVLKVGLDLPPALRIEVEDFLEKNLDVFTGCTPIWKGSTPKSCATL